MSDTSETRWFKVIVFISTGFIAGVSLANIIYYDRIRKSSRTCSAVTNTEATTMVALNVVIFILAVIVFLWSLWKLLFDRSIRDKAQDTFTDFWLSDKSPITYNPQTPGTTVVVAPAGQNPVLVAGAPVGMQTAPLNVNPANVRYAAGV